VRSRFWRAIDWLAAKFAVPDMSRELAVAERRLQTVIDHDDPQRWGSERDL
jgi:hypothetical protein